MHEFTGFIKHNIMRIKLISLLISAMSLFSISAFSQTANETEKDSTLLGLPGDNLDLYAVLDLFQKSKTIEDFEKSLNEEKTGINNLDLDLDGKVDFIKVVTKKNGEDFTFILQVDVSKTEKQDVAVILVSKDKNKKVTIQVVGDKDLYGKNYIVEPKEQTTPAVTANPGYTGSDPVKVSAPASTTTIVVESAPIVQYVYSPVYVPYVPPYYYGYYPPYFAAFTVMSIGIYRHNNYYYHGGYGYHGNTTVIHNTNNYNYYNNSRNSSTTVNRNNANGNYNRNNATTRPAGSGTSGSNRPTSRPAATTRPSNGASPATRPSNGASPATRPSKAPSASTRQSGQSSPNRQSNPSVSNRQSAPSSSRINSGGSRGGNNGGSGKSGVSGGNRSSGSSGNMHNGGGSRGSSAGSRGGGGGGGRGGRR
jgi:uncharacterized membrane protein YgcG